MSTIQRSRASTADSSQPGTPDGRKVATPDGKKKKKKKKKMKLDGFANDGRMGLGTPPKSPKLSLATNRGLALSQSAPALRGATPSGSEASTASRPQTAALGPDEGWLAVRTRGAHSIHSRVADTGVEDQSWDAIFNGIATLEKNAELKRSASLPRTALSDHRRPQTGKWWQTRDSMAPISFLAPELSDLSTTCATVDPPHKRDRRAQTAAARIRSKPKPLAEVIDARKRPIPRLYNGRRRKFPTFMDNDPNPLVRLTRLQHMGF